MTAGGNWTKERYFVNTIMYDNMSWNVLCLFLPLLIYSSTCCKHPLTHLTARWHACLTWRRWQYWSTKEKFLLTFLTTSVLTWPLLSATRTRTCLSQLPGSSEVSRTSLDRCRIRLGFSRKREKRALVSIWRCETKNKKQCADEGHTYCDVSGYVGFDGSKNLWAKTICLGGKKIRWIENWN